MKNPKFKFLRTKIKELWEERGRDVVDMGRGWTERERRKSKKKQDVTVYVPIPHTGSVMHSKYILAEVFKRMWTNIHLYAVVKHAGGGAAGKEGLPPVLCGDRRKQACLLSQPRGATPHLNKGGLCTLICNSVFPTRIYAILTNSFQWPQSTVLDVDCHLVNYFPDCGHLNCF